jgi:hypothetical protein
VTGLALPRRADRWIAVLPAFALSAACGLAYAQAGAGGVYGGFRGPGTQASAYPPDGVQVFTPNVVLGWGGRPPVPAWPGYSVAVPPPWPANPTLYPYAGQGQGQGGRPGAGPPPGQLHRWAPEGGWR